jgi:glycosyltransferase involved in cell wall biosynthesis
VGLDVTPSIVAMSGLRHYCDETWRQLRAREDVDVHAFGAGRGQALAHPARRVPVPLRVLQAMWRTARWPTTEALVGKVDLVHSLDLLAPPTRAPLVVTVMDVIWRAHPDLVAPVNRRMQEAHLESARRADIVVTGAAATASEIAEAGRIAPDRIVVTPYGRHPVDPAGGQEVDGPFILSVSTIEPRKGFEVLARAMALLPDGPQVLVAGPDGWRAGEVKQQIAQVDRGHRFRYLGDVRDPARLAALYRDATVVCQPSLAEGFGFPVLEAMGVGAAVVASDIPQHREIGGDAVVLAAPGDPEALADAIGGVLDDSQRAASMREAARRRAAPWSWERTTDALVAAYRRAIDG